ncbi:hypothetical protein IQ03_03877 [Gemmobacter caeni]|uniref:Uncharacterized protein n=1 Tax=Gemmobacter caeni TaxID=589035 RepID=A0A2T6B9F2_9RHOB|nr:hypothetical protein [Gemmobacter caeni]PTX52666.1 hypothetical protein C8N34_102485 [Gemmobacter caeni]TWI94879.1 hypothetical protein IQ03_03877 [Gemmobacter caeni]
MAKDPQLARTIRRMRRARRFAQNTCPASRHAQLIAETLAEGRDYPMLREEPEHVAGSIASVVADLFAARTVLDQLGYTWTVRPDGAVIWKRKTNQSGEET